MGCDGSGIWALWVSKSFGWVTMGGPWTTSIMKLSRGWHWGITFTPSLWSKYRTFTACYTWGSVNEQAISNAESMTGQVIHTDGRGKWSIYTSNGNTRDIDAFCHMKISDFEIWILQCFGVNAKLITIFWLFNYILH